jgi:hypothetical protein
MGNARHTSDLGGLASRLGISEEAQVILDRGASGLKPTSVMLRGLNRLRMGHKLPEVMMVVVAVVVWGVLVCGCC